MGPQELIKHMTSRPGPPTSRTHFVFGIERSASTELPLPGEAFSLAEKIGAPSRPENRDFMRFTGLTGLAWHIAKHSKKERILPFNFARNSSIHRTMRRSCVLGFRSWWFWETLGAPGTYKTQDFEARPFDIESALCLWNRAFCLDRTTISWRGIFFRRKNLWPQQTWKSGFYRIYGASQRHANVRLCWIQSKSPFWILTFFLGNFQTSTSLLK